MTTQQDFPEELSDKERKELEELRALKREMEEKERIKQERAELEALRDEQRRQEEYRKIAYEAAQDRVAQEIEDEKFDAQFAKGNIPSMPQKQKIILLVLAIVFIAGIIYILKDHGVF